MGKSRRTKSTSIEAINKYKFIWKKNKNDFRAYLFGSPMVVCDNLLQYPRTKRNTSLMVAFVGICATSEVILIVLVLYFLVPPTGVHTDAITHINPRKNQCKPWGKNTQENNKNKSIFVFPQGRSALIMLTIWPCKISLGKSV